MNTVYSGIEATTQTSPGGIHTGQRWLASVGQGNRLPPASILRRTNQTEHNRAKVMPSFYSFSDEGRGKSRCVVINPAKAPVPLSLP